MTAQLAPRPLQKFFDNNGIPLAAGKLYSYAAGTTTPQATYVDSTQTTQNTNPVILNFRGEASVWLDPTLSYKLNLTDLNGNQIPGFPVDNINGQLSSILSLIPAVDNTYNLGSTSFAWAQLYLGANHEPALDTASGTIGYYPKNAAENAASVTPTNFYINRYKDVPLERYGVVVGGSTSLAAANTTAIQNAINVAAALSNTGGVIIVPQGTIYVQANSLTMGTNAVNWLGEGKGQSFMQSVGASSDQPILSFLGTSGTPIDSIFVRGIAFSSDNQAARGITATWVKNSVWDDLYFYNLRNGWVGSTCFGSGFRNNNAYNVLLNTYTLGSSGTSGGCSNSVFDKCRMVGANGVVVNFATDSILFDGCDFEGIISNGAGINLAPPTGSIVSAVKVLGSHFENVNGTAIYAVGTDANSIAGLTVKGCFIKGGFSDSGNTNAKNAIQLGKVNGYDISDNNFVDWGTDDATGGGTQGYAIYTAGAASNAVNGNIERNRSGQSTVGGAVIRTVQNVCDVTPDTSVRVTNNWSPVNGTGFTGYQSTFANPGEVTITYSASMSIDANTGSIFDITATNNTGFTINNPTNGYKGRRIWIKLRNTSGGALGTITWGGATKVATHSPASATSYTWELTHDGTNWIQTGGTPADVPN